MIPNQRCVPKKRNTLKENQKIWVIACKGFWNCEGRSKGLVSLINQNDKNELCTAVGSMIIPKMVASNEIIKNWHCSESLLNCFPFKINTQSMKWLFAGVKIIHWVFLMTSGKTVLDFPNMSSRFIHTTKVSLVERLAFVCIYKLLIKLNFWLKNHHWFIFKNLVKSTFVKKGRTSYKAIVLCCMYFLSFESYPISRNLEMIIYILPQNTFLRFFSMIFKRDVYQ